MRTRQTPSRNPVRSRNTSLGGCPVCGEKRITEDIYSPDVTYLCGYSGYAGKPITACQGTYFQQFLEAVEESIWEGVW